MATIKFDDDDGYSILELSSIAGPVAIKIDVFRAYNVWNGLCDQHPDMVERADAWIAWLQTQGFPAVSHANAFAVALTIQNEADAIKKKLGWPSENVVSPGSTASTAPDCPPAPPAT